MRPCPATQPRPPRDPERQNAITDDLARSHGPCRRSAARRPLLRSAIALRIASARSPISAAPGASARMAARIAAGFSLRGLSSVTMTLSASSTAIAAHDRPLAAVAVAAGAEHHDQLAASHKAAALASAFLQRVRLVRVVDEDRRAVAVADELEPPLGAGEVLERCESACRLGAGRDGETRRNERVLTWKAPTSGSFTLYLRPPCAMSMTCAKPSMAPPTSLMSSPCSPTVMTFSRALARGIDHLPGIAIVIADITAVPPATIRSSNRRSLAAR